MADILSLETPYQDQDTVTSTNLNDLVKKATFTSAVVDGATTQLSSGAIIVRDGGITTNKLDQARLSGVIEAPLSNAESFVGGTKAGNARGSFALDIQNKRTSAPATEVASGDSSSAFGFENTASGDNSVAIGYNNFVSGLSSMAFGKDNQAIRTDGVAVGRVCYANMNGGVAIGNGSRVINTDSNITQGISIGVSCVVHSDHGILIGNNMFMGGSTGRGATEIGQWSQDGDSNGRFFNNSGSSMRMHYDKQIAFSVKSSSTAPVDGGSSVGIEANGSLPREMFTIQRNGDAFSLYLNDGGTIKSLSLGTVS